MLQSRTEGNPLFMVRMLDYAVAQRVIAESGDGWRLVATQGELDTLFPANLLGLIARELSQVTDDERQVLEAASVVGGESTLAEVAAALQLERDLVDQRSAPPVQLDISAAVPAGRRHARGRDHRASDVRRAPRGTPGPLTLASFAHGDPRGNGIIDQAFFPCLETQVEPTRADTVRSHRDPVYTGLSITQVELLQADNNLRLRLEGHIEGHRHTDCPRALVLSIPEFPSPGVRRRETGLSNLDHLPRPRSLWRLSFR